MLRYLFLSSARGVGQWRLSAVSGLLWVLTWRLAARDSRVEARAIRANSEACAMMAFLPPSCAAHPPTKLDPPLTGPVMSRASRGTPKGQPHRTRFAANSTTVGARLYSAVWCNGPQHGPANDPRRATWL